MLKKTQEYIASKPIKSKKAAHVWKILKPVKRPQSKKSSRCSMSFVLKQNFITIGRETTFRLDISSIGVVYCLFSLHKHQ